MAEQMQPIQKVQEITEPLAIKDQGDIPRFNEASARNLKDMRDLSKNLNDDFIPKWNASRSAVNTVVTNIKAIQDAPTQAANAAKSAAAALASQNAAKASENAALASKNAAKASETNAKTSETAAKASLDVTKVSETNAKASENAALASKNAAKTSETNAANSATAANNSKNAAATSATNAANSATAALGSQNAAKASENAALASKNAAKTSETNAKTSETAAKASQDSAKVSETNSKASENAALASKNAAKTSETNAANSATAANSSKTAAATSATNAANSATAALSSQNAAKTSENAAKVAQVAAEAARDKAEVIAGGKFAVETRRIIAGTGLSGGGDLSADRTLTVKYGTAAGTACQGNDARLSNARTPTPHKATHKTGGTDALTPADIGAAANTITVSAGNGLTGGGNLTANRSLAVNYATSAPLMDGAAAVGTSVQLSRGDHRHPSDTSRLPLAGGTMTGNLVVPAAGFWLRIKDAATTTLRNFRVLTGYGHDANGAGLAITANGLTILGGGESPNTLFNAANLEALGITPGHEHAIVAADAEVWFLTGIQNFANRKLIKITNVGILETAQQIRFLNGEADKIRMIQGNYGFIMRHDGKNFYFLVTASGQQTGTWTSARPLTINLSTGVCSINGNAATASAATSLKFGNTTVTGITDSTTSNASNIIASAKAVKSVMDTLNSLKENVMNSGLTNGTPSRQCFFTPGNYTFTVPAGVTRVLALVIGGGGNGSTSGGGGGGSASGYITVTSGQKIAVTVGNRGGTSSFGTFISCTGGSSGSSGGGGGSATVDAAVTPIFSRKGGYGGGGGGGGGAGGNGGGGGGGGIGGNGAQGGGGGSFTSASSTFAGGPFEGKHTSDPNDANGSEAEGDVWYLYAINALQGGGGASGQQVIGLNNGGNGGAGGGGGGGYTIESSKNYYGRGGNGGIGGGGGGGGRSASGGNGGIGGGGGGGSGDGGTGAVVVFW